MSAAQPILSLENVSVSLPGRAEGCYLTVLPGECIVIAGRSGSDKSALLSTAAGFHHPARGTVQLLGVNVERLRRRDSPEVRRKTSFVFSEPVLIHGLTALDNILLPLRYDDNLSESEVAQRFAGVLQDARLARNMDVLAEDLNPLEFRQTILARAWIRKPELVFYDEPARDLDPVSQTALYRIIHAYHRERGCAAVIACNDPRCLLEFADRFFLLKNGVLTSEADKNNIPARRAQIEKDFFEPAESP